MAPTLLCVARRLITFLDVWYDAGLELHLVADCTLEDIFAQLEPETLHHAIRWAGTDASQSGTPGITPPPMPAKTGTSMAVRSEGGSSSGWATTFFADGTEWSATGRMGVSLSALSGLQDAAFARRRAESRLVEMLGCWDTPTVAEKPSS
mmetsp:Transcript_16588/g.42594  ORF Transcript_16588/g.42594 Transcript_16588/m.42594 type:complete len:150 (-) Transcript_16588:356-805(-)